MSVGHYGIHWHKFIRDTCISWGGTLAPNFTEYKQSQG